MNRTQDAHLDRDIFVSYASEDRARVAPIVSWLESRGWTVWWDRTIAPGQRWDETIERALNAARCVLVVWSQSSRESDWVKTEAAVAARRNALVPIRIDDVEAPLEFSRLQALDLIDWRGQSDTPELRLLEQTIAGALGRPPAPQPVRVQPKRNRRFVVAATAVIVLALGGWWFYARITGPVHSGAALASAAVLLLDDLDRKTDESGAHWPFALAEGGNGTLLQQATLLGVEAVRRGARAEGEAALRRSLALLTRPARTFAHGVAMTCLAVSADGTRVATGGEDGSIAIWDIATARLVARFAAHTDIVQHLAFSPDSRILASGGRDNTARLSDPQSGRELARLRHEDMVWSVAFSPDGTRLATAADETSHVWSVADGRELHRLKHAANVRAALFTSDGKFLVTAPGTSGSPALVSVWDVSSGHRVKELGGANDRFYGIATRGSVIAAGKRGGIDLWRTPDWTPAGRIAFDSWITLVAVSPDGELVAGGQGSARYGAVTVNTIAADTSNARIVARRRNSGVYGLLFNADATLIAAVAQDQTAQVLEVPGGRELLRARTYEHAHLRSASLGFTPDGKYLVTASATGANLWEIRPADLVSEACARAGRSLAPEEWQRFVPGERYRPTCVR